MVNNNFMTHNYRSAPIQLSESTEGTFPTEVQLLKEGTFQDARYDRFPVTKKMLAEMVANFKRGVRGVRPAIDFKHDSDAEAAAWIKDLFIKVIDGKHQLWATPDWTGEGKRKLSDRVYGYLSAEFNQNYKDNEEGKSHGCVLLGAALTNRPVIKNMQPVIQLAENQGDPVDQEQEKKEVKKLDEGDLKLISDLMAKMGVSSVEELMKKIAESKQEQPQEMADAQKKLGDMEKKLSEMSTKVTALEAEKVTLKKSNEFNKMLAEAKVCEAQRKPFLDGDMVKFAEAAQPLNTEAQGTETGTDGKEEKEDKTLDDEDKVLKLAEAKVQNKEAKDIGSAISMVLKEQKK